MVTMVRLLSLLIGLILVSVMNMEGTHALHERGMPRRAEEEEEVKRSKNRDNPVIPATLPPRPTMSPTVSPAPTQAPTTVEQKTACKVAAKSGIYPTDKVLTVRYLYELLTTADRDIKKVARAVDGLVQDFLVEEFIVKSCEKGKLSDTYGVGPSDVDTVVEQACSMLEIEDNATQVCYFMEGTVDLFLSDTSELSQDEGEDIVLKRLSRVFNGKRRALQQQSLLVDESLGILGVYFKGGHVIVEEEPQGGEVDPGGDVPADANTVISGDWGSAMSWGAVTGIAVGVVVGIATLVTLFFLVLRKQRLKQQTRGLPLVDDESLAGSCLGKPPPPKNGEQKDKPQEPPAKGDSKRGLLCFADDDTLGRPQWKDMEHPPPDSYQELPPPTTDEPSKPAAAAMVTLTTEEDEEEDSISSGEINFEELNDSLVMNLSVMTLSQSLTEEHHGRPIFIDPDDPKVCYRTPKAFQGGRTYWTNDTVDL